MNEKDFGHLRNQYRDLLQSTVLSRYDLGRFPPGFDWLSDLYVRGTLSCTEEADCLLRRGSKVLDFGCGMGLVYVLLNRLGHEVIGIDIDVGGSGRGARADGQEWGSRQAELENPRLISECWEALSATYGILYLLFDGRQVPFEDGSFDAVIMHAVLEHVPPENLPAVLDEIHRVLDDNGYLFVFRTPRKDSYLEQLSRHLGYAAHEKLYSEPEVENLISGSGFSLVRSGVTDMLPAFPPVGLSLYNKMAPLTSRLDRLLLATPLRRYAHHMALAFEKH